MNDACPMKLERRREQMKTFCVSKRFAWQGVMTDKVSKVCRMFGVSIERLRAGLVEHRCKINVADGDIVYITGPSGAGKSVLLAEIEKQIPDDEKISLNDIELDASKSVIDCIDGDLLRSLRLLSTAGLASVFCMLNQPANLSEGQQYRFRLAKALAADKKYVFADEFCSTLDRITACSIAYNIRRFAKRSGTTFVLASSCDDILADLQPDALVVKDFTGNTEVIYKDSKRVNE
jgi:ABC-type ATPase with predicted acetyltransferase domain